MSKLTATTPAGLAEIEAHLEKHPYISGAALPSGDDARIVAELKGNIC